ncbi:MAG TPA: HEAT repeat domain-containing protein, partial [Myxococcota bacterium]|nr:HEAT repeat domain-containing protein [Myxococcota bacterium]
MTTSGRDFYKAELEAARIAALLEAGELTPNEVVEGLWHGQALVRRNAARGARFVHELPDPGEAMLRIASKDPDEQVRAAVVSAVAGGLAGLPVAMPLLFDAVLDGGEGIRDTAIQGLESRLVSDPLALPYLIEALGDLRPAVFASQLLIKVGGDRAASALVAVLGHGDPQRRKTAFDVLERLAARVVGELIDALSDATIRPLGVRLIAGLGDVASVQRQALERHLLSADTSLVEAVGKLLSQLGRPIEPPRTAPLDIPIPDFLVRRLDEAEL